MYVYTEEDSEQFHENFLVHRAISVYLRISRKRATINTLCYFLYRAKRNRNVARYDCIGMNNFASNQQRNELLCVTIS